MKIKLGIVVLLLAFCQTSIYAQILDDTTKILYGPKTTKYRLEKDIFWGLDIPVSVDTNSANQDRQDNWPLYLSGYMAMDLGNLGTALRPLYLQAPKQVGVRNGIETYSPYAFDPQNQKYYNTLSPYSYANYMLGSNGRDMLRMGIHRNINNKWNLGLDYKSISSVKQIGPSKTDDPQTDHHSIVIKTSYISTKARYMLFANYSFMNHTVYETGGVKPLASDSVGGRLRTDSLFNYSTQLVRLSSTAYTSDVRNAWHLYHQYSLDTNNKVQIYHQFDRLRQRNGFLDRMPTTSNLYADQDAYGNGALFRSDTLFNELKYNNIENALGVKWQLAKGFKLAAYYRHRAFDRSGLYAQYNGIKHENYLGARLYAAAFRHYSLEAQAEYIPGRDYYINAKLLGTDWEVMALSTHAAPNMFMQQYTGTFQNWNNDFNFVNTQYITAKYLKDITKGFSFGLKVESQVINNYIYLDYKSLPKQSINAITTNKIDLVLNFKFRHICFDNLLIAATTSSPSIIRLPRLHTISRYYYQGRVFKNALVLQTGFETRWLADYYADNYNPTIQQFYVQRQLDPNLSAAQQNNFSIPAAFVTDVFINMGIKRSSIFLKLSNALAGLGAPGYFTGRIYPGLPRSLIFGVNWQFFN